MRIIRLTLASIGLALISACAMAGANPMDAETAKQIREDKEMDLVLEKARTLLKDGLNAGSGYNEVWIRDLNTFIELALDVRKPEEIRDSLLVFFRALFE